MLSDPLVSVLIPAYNHEEYVLETLESIRSQSYENLELIILNDGSTDRTAEVIQDFAAIHIARFKRYVFVDKSNEGVAATLNRGLTLTEGEFIFHIASDDVVASPMAIELLVKQIMKSPLIGMACGDADFIDKDGNPIQFVRKGRSYSSFIEWNFPNILGLDTIKDFGSYQSFLIGNYIPVGLLVRKEVYEQVGGYLSGKLVEDYEFWLRLSKEYRFQFYPATFAHYRVHGSNTVNMYGSKLRQEVVDLYLRERNYALVHGYSKYWYRGACIAGLNTLYSSDKVNKLKVFKILLLSFPAWPSEFFLFLQRVYTRLKIFKLKKAQ